MSIYRAVAYALTGQVFPDQPASLPSEIVEVLAHCGWGRSELEGFRQQCQAHALRWPRPISPGLRGQISAAQVRAVTQAVIVELSLGEPARLRDASRPLDARDRALLAEVPPHHGKVG